MPSAVQTLFNGRNAMASMVKAKATGKRIPVRVNLLVTKFCNLTCFYCYAEDILNKKEVEEFSFEELINIIDQVYESGCRWINILGGEPLLRNDIEELIDYMKQKGMLVEMTTNGYFIKKRISALKKIDHLAISLDGNKESNDRARGEDSFEKIVEGIEYAVQNGIKVRIHATLSKRTMAGESLEFLSNFCKKLNIQFNYSENGLPGIEEMDPDFLLSAEETLEFYKSYKSLKKAGYPIVSSDVAVEYVDKWPLGRKTTIYKKDLPHVPKDSYYPCSLGRTQCFISADGNVYPCSKKWGEGINIRDGGFQKAWDHLSDLDCVACKELGTIEQSVILGLEVRGLVNGILNFAI